MGRGKRQRRDEPTDEWEQAKLLRGWPERLAYEEIRPLVLFVGSVAERARETGAAERTRDRTVSSIGAEGAALQPLVRPCSLASWTNPRQGRVRVLEAGEQMSRHVPAEAHKRAVAKAPAAIRHLRNLKPRDRQFSIQHTAASEAARRRTRRRSAGFGHEAYRGGAA